MKIPIAPFYILPSYFNILDLPKFHYSGSSKHSERPPAISSNHPPAELTVWQALPGLHWLLLSSWCLRQPTEPLSGNLRLPVQRLLWLCTLLAHIYRGGESERLVLPRAGTIHTMRPGASHCQWRSYTRKLWGIMSGVISGAEWRGLLRVAMFRPDGITSNYNECDGD